MPVALVIDLLVFYFPASLIFRNSSPIVFLVNGWMFSFTSIPPPIIFLQKSISGQPQLLVHIKSPFVLSFSL